MIKPDLTKWKYAEQLEGLLIFAQALEEMLFDHTLDTYKATALNLQTNTLELRYLARLLRNNQTKVGALEPVIAELEDRFRKDVVIQPAYRSVYSHYLRRITQVKAKPGDLIATLDALWQELDAFYWQALLSLIEHRITEVKRKSDLIYLANAFITEAELKGFSRRFIYYRTQGFFFKVDVQPRTIQTTGQIRDYLALFNQEPPAWQVIFRGASHFHDLATYSKDFGSPTVKLEISDSAPPETPGMTRESKKFLAESRPTQTLFITTGLPKLAEIREPIAARDVARASIDTLSHAYAFVTHEEQPGISDDAVVLNETTGESSVISPSPNPMKCGIQRQSAAEARPEMQLLIEILSGKHFDAPSSRMFLNSLEFHRAALEATTAENQLLDLWAALEGFLPSPSGEEARVTHYLNSLTPSLILTYPEKILRFVADAIVHGGGRCRTIVEESAVGADFFGKAVAIMVCADLRDRRELLYAELGEHVLLRHRIYECHEWFGSKSHIKESIQLHRQRVSWHIQRIYTTRNQIIHSARALPYLRTLVENLHAYLDILMETASVAAWRAPVQISIHSALESLFVHEKGYLASLDGEDEECTSQNHVDLLFGKDNPVNPFRGISFY